MLQALLLTFISLFVISLVSLIFYKRRLHKYFISNIKIPGKVVIITGANTGIGYEIAKELSKRGARVILACRDLCKAQKAASEIRLATRNEVEIRYLDLAYFKTIVAFCKDIVQNVGRVDILINNAVTGYLDNSLTEDGLPIEAQVNYFGPFLLTHLLLPVMKNLPDTARIINISSLMHMLGTIQFLDQQATSFVERRRVYANTKLATVLFTKKLAEEMLNKNIAVNCCQPGIVYTERFRNHFKIIRLILKFFCLTPRQGAQTPIYLAARRMVPGSIITGKYFSNCEEDTPAVLGRSSLRAEILWETSLRVCSGHLRYENK